MRKLNCTGELMAGVILGGLVGAAFALLYAPQSGEETRKMLKEKADEAKKEMEKKKQQAIKKAKEVQDDVEEGIEDIKDRAKRASQEFQKQTKGEES